MAFSALPGHDSRKPLVEGWLVRRDKKRRPVSFAATLSLTGRNIPGRLRWLLFDSTGDRLVGGRIMLKLASTGSRSCGAGPAHQT